MASPGDWVLAIDFGTTNTVAAVTDARGTTTLMVDGKPATPSAVFLNPDRKTWSVGDTAIRIARRRLEWFDANPKRGVPDNMLFLGGQNVPVGEAITAVLRPIVQEAVSQRGGRKPAAFIVTHPAHWGEARVAVLVDAAAAAAGRGWPRPQPLSEPVAAVQAILGMDDIPRQARLVVLDLGASTVDATVVDRDGDVLTVAGQPQGRDGIGGEDYDQRLARWMVAEVGAEGLYDRLATSDDPERRELAVEIRADARNIKEQLSRQAIVPAQLPKSPPELPEITPVMVSRPQLEALICGGPGHGPGLAESVDVVSSVLDSAPPGPLFVGVFLTGGCSRIPLLGALVQERTGRPPFAYGDPTTAVAQGAAEFAWRILMLGGAAPERAKAEAIPTSSGGIFISYRREDAASAAGRLFDWLGNQFGMEQVFADVDSISPGDDFVEKITSAVASCTVLLAVIGNRWLTAAGDDARPRLEDPHDFVRLEISAALSRGIRVIPILVEGARMPGEGDLPDGLAPLSRRQAVRLSPDRWGTDIRRLLHELDKILAQHRAP